MGTTAGAWDGDGVWLKTALHTHTSDTDGELPPRAVAEHYEWAGFDVLAITDHWTLTSVPSSEHLLVITGAELAVDPLGKGRYTEILAIGIDEIPEDPGGDRAYWERIDNYDFKTFPDLSTAAAFITGQGGAAFVAHPYWSGLPPEVILNAEGLTGLELFNASSERENGRGDSSYIWDLALEAGRSLSAIATDDSHYPLFDIGDAWTMVRAADRSRDAVLDSLRAGRTYASNGPVLHDVRRDGDRIEVAVLPLRLGVPPDAVPGRVGGACRPPGTTGGRPDPAAERRRVGGPRRVPARHRGPPVRPRRGDGRRGSEEPGPTPSDPLVGTADAIP